MLAMPYIRESLWSFYLEGREARLVKTDMSDEDLSKAVKEADGPMLTTLAALAKPAIAALENGRVKRGWIEERKDDILACEESEDDAYRAFLAGRADKLVLKLERRVSNELFCEFTDDSDPDGLAIDDEDDGEDDED